MDIDPVALETTVKASEGKLGRVFMIRLDGDEIPAEAIEKFAADEGILAAHVFVVSDHSLVGIIAPGADDAPRLRLSDTGRDGTAGAGTGDEREVIVQEVLGIDFKRVVDPRSGRSTLARIAAAKTRVLEKAAPEPPETGPGTIPVYLFNAEFN